MESTTNLVEEGEKNGVEEITERNNRRSLNGGQEEGEKHENIKVALRLGKP